MAKIRRFDLGFEVDAVVAVHGFNVNSEGELIYTKARETNTKLQDINQNNEYLMYEIGTRDYSYEIDDNGELVLKYSHDQ